MCAFYVLLPLMHLENDKEFMALFNRRFFVVIFISILIQPLAVILGILSLLDISRDCYCRDKWPAGAGILIAIVTMVMMAYKIMTD